MAATSGSVGDVFWDYQDIANNDFLDLKPDAGYQGVVHNAQWEGAIEIYKLGPAGSFTFDADGAAGGFNFYALHCTNTHYYRIKNVSGGNIDITYDGIFTKAP